MRNPRNDTLAADDTGTGGERDQAPERRCILSGRHAARDELVRLAVSPEGQVLPDALARAPGRGAWIGVSRDELRDAIASGRLRGALGRAYRSGGLHVPDDLPELIENALHRALCQRLGLELRAGRLILGFDRIEAEARTGRVAALYHSADAGEDGARKLDQAWRVGRGAEGSGLAGDRLPLDREALSVALGRENVVHLALADQASARRVLVPLRRLLNFVNAGPAAGSGAGPAAGSGDCAAKDAARETRAI